jgi:UDP-perosamine 4-acetyltransferase
VTHRASATDNPLVVIGAGEHAHPVLELLDALGVIVAGLADRTLSAGVLGREVIVTLDELASLPARGIRSAVVAIGNNEVRRRVADRAREAGLCLPVIVHPTACVSPSAELGAGVQVMAQAFVGPMSRLDPLVLVNTGAIVEHHCRVGVAAHVAPRSVLCGTVSVGAQCLIGAGAVVIPGRSIGEHTVIGAGSVVTRHIEAGLKVAGVPAVPLRVPSRA